MHDANIRVAIAGAGGRMGRQLIQAALALEGVQLGAALEREGSSLARRIFFTGQRCGRTGRSRENRRYCAK